MKNGRPNAEQDELAHSQMTFGQHLDELRTRLVRSLIASFVGLVAVFVYHEEVFWFVTDPYRVVMESQNLDTALNATGPAQAFFAHIKVSLIVGLILTAPFWIHQLWAFVSAGLYRRERRVIYRFAPLCLILFAGGVTFGYYVLIPIGLNYLLTFADPSVVKNIITITEYLRLFTVLTLLLGVAFQLPIVMLGLVKAGITTPTALVQKRKWAILGIFVMAALFTPPDPVTQVLLAMPLLILYQLGVFLGWASLGADRPPVNWRAQRRLWSKILVVAAVVFVFRGQLRSFWEQEKWDDRLFRSDGSQPPITELAEEFLEGDEDARGAVRVLDGDDRSLWSVRLDGRTVLLELTTRRVKYQIVDRSSGSGQQPYLDFVHYPQPKAAYRLKKPSKVSAEDFVGPLLSALRDGKEDVQAEVRFQLAQLTGIKAEGDGALAAYEKWYQEHRSHVFDQ